MLGELSVSCSVRAGVLSRNKETEKGLRELKMMNIGGSFCEFNRDEFKQEKEVLSYILEDLFQSEFQYLTVIYICWWTFPPVGWSAPHQENVD